MRGCPVQELGSCASATKALGANSQCRPGTSTSAARCTAAKVAPWHRVRPSYYRQFDYQCDCLQRPGPARPPRLRTAQPERRSRWRKRGHGSALSVLLRPKGVIITCMYMYVLRAPYMYVPLENHRQSRVAPNKPLHRPPREVCAKKFLAWPRLRVVWPERSRHNSEFRCETQGPAGSAHTLRVLQSPSEARGTRDSGRQVVQRLLRQGPEPMSTRLLDWQVCMYTAHHPGSSHGHSGPGAAAGLV